MGSVEPNILNTQAAEKNMPQRNSNSTLNAMKNNLLNKAGLQDAL